MVCPTASPHLNPGLAEPQPVAELLPHESVRVVRLVKQPLQLVQLLQREVGPEAQLKRKKFRFSFSLENCFSFAFRMPKL